MRKKILIAVMILLNVLAAAGQTVVGEKTIEDITYVAYSDGTACVKDANKNISGYVIVPQEINIKEGKYKVTTIGDYAFDNCRLLRKITLPKTITSIGIRSISSCYSLESVTLPNSVTTIGNHAFSSCSSLKEIILPCSVTSIGSYAFSFCESMERITVPNSVTSIGKHAFGSCYSLKEITLPNYLTSIDDETFHDCLALESITIPNSVTFIGEKVFMNCRSLKEIIFPNSVASIGAFAFDDCKSLERIIIPDSVTYVGNSPLGWSVITDKEIVFTSDAQKEKFADKFKDKSRKSSENVRIVVNENALAQYSFNPSAPPSIDFVANSLQFVDANGNNAIDAEEKCTIRLQVTNSGKGDARNCVAKITSATIPGVTYKNVDIPQIRAGETKTVEIPLTVNLQTQNGTAKFSIQIDEPNGFGTDAVSLSVNTRAFDAPMLRVVDYATVSADGSSVLAKKSAFDLQILLQNVEAGKAENVQVSIEVPNNVFLMDTQNQKTFTSINGGDTKKITYSLIANNNYAGNSIPVKVNVKEKHGKYAESRTIDLPLNQTLRNHNIVLEEKNGDGQKKDIQIASIGSDVDKNIPSSAIRNDKTFAVIIANENYNKEANVPYAVNDGSVFSEYCSTTLGVPTNNIHLVRNATLNDIRHEVNWITNVMDASGGKAKVLFYYAGHGIPDEKTRTAYLLPVDGYGSDVTTGYPLANLYSALGESPSQSVTVFLDACFSGTKREGDMMASARGVAIKVNETSPVGNMVVFSASQGDETAYPYTEQGHGLFTYFLLKKLQDTAGDVTLGDLSDYVIEQVKLQSVVINSKPQTPTIIPSPNMSGSWRSETLK